MRKSTKIKLCYGSLWSFFLFLNCHKLKKCWRKSVEKIIFLSSFSYGVFLQMWWKYKEMVFDSNRYELNKKIQYLKCTSNIFIELIWHLFLIFSCRKMKIINKKLIKVWILFVCCNVMSFTAGNMFKLTFSTFRNYSNLLFHFNMLCYRENKIISCS